MCLLSTSEVKSVYRSALTGRVKSREVHIFRHHMKRDRNSSNSLLFFSRMKNEVSGLETRIPFLTSTQPANHSVRWMWARQKKEERKDCDENLKKHTGSFALVIRCCARCYGVSSARHTVFTWKWRSDLDNLITRKKSVCWWPVWSGGADVHVDSFLHNYMWANEFCSKTWKIQDCPPK